MSESVAPAAADQRPKSRMRRILEGLALVVIGTPVAIVVGSIAGYIGGVVVAYIWSTPRQPPQDLAYIRDWAGLVGAIGGAVVFLFEIATSKRAARRRQELAAERAVHYRAWLDAGYEHREIPEFKSWRNALLERINNWVAVAAVIAAAFVFDVFDHFAGHQYLAGAAVLFGLPALAWIAFQTDKGEYAKTWALAGAAVLLIFGARGVSTSFYHGYANCWNVRTAGEWEIVDCAPGSEPVQSVPGYDRWTDTETPGRECIQTETDAGSATRWRCHSID